MRTWSIALPRPHHAVWDVLGTACLRGARLQCKKRVGAPDLGRTLRARKKAGFRE